jgi:predicted phosphohydrolase
MPTCHACGAEIPAVERIGRRQACEGCGAELHCCLNCRHYSPGMHNDCSETQAERVVDKARANFCDYFALHGAARPAAAGGDARARLEALFRKRST